MTGLEQIMDTVHRDAQERANEIISEAKNRASKAEEEQKQSLLNGEMRARDELAAAVLAMEEKGAAATLRKVGQARLETKQKLIDQLVALVEQELHSMTNAEYETFVLTRLADLSLNQKGELYFVSRNGVVVEDDLKNKIQKSYPGLEILEASLPGDGGFILKIGEIQENYTFGTMLNEKRDWIRDEANRLLFSQEETI